MKKGLLKNGGKKMFIVLCRMLGNEYGFMWMNRRVRLFLLLLLMFSIYTLPILYICLLVLFLKIQVFLQTHICRPHKFFIFSFCMFQVFLPSFRCSNVIKMDFQMHGEQIKSAEELKNCSAGFRFPILAKEAIQVKVKLY